MDRLWTPWRYAYITGNDSSAHRRKGVPQALDAWPGEHDCVFCNMIAAVDYAVAHGTKTEDAEHAAYVLERGESCFLCLNAFPYSTGHILIVPYQHTGSLAALPPRTAAEMIHLGQRVERTLRSVYRPDGLNLGLNLGEAAGAGVADHIHMHALPRWSGDGNFMTVIAETRILPETLDITWERVRSNLRESTPTQRA